jgi:hypothetical protein
MSELSALIADLDALGIETVWAERVRPPGMSDADEGILILSRTADEDSALAVCRGVLAEVLDGALRAS